MKLLKTIFLGLVTAVSLVLLIARLLPSTYHVERSIVIYEPASQVYPQVSNLKNWAHWNPWTTTDPTAKNFINGSGKDIGSSWSWEGKKIGTGSLTLHRLRENRLVHSHLVFKEPQTMEAENIWRFEPVPEGTRVIWYNEGKLDYPVGRIFGLFLDNILGPDFEKGLTNLKQLSENS